MSEVGISILYMTLIPRDNMVVGKEGKQCPAKLRSLMYRKQSHSCVKLLLLIRAINYGSLDPKHCRSREQTKRKVWNGCIPPLTPPTTTYISMH